MKVYSMNESGLECPECGNRTHVADSRLTKDKQNRIRKYHCRNCGFVKRNIMKIETFNDKEEKEIQMSIFIQTREARERKLRKIAHEKRQFEKKLREIRERLSRVRYCI